MEFEDEGFVLSARTHGESGAIVEVLTSTRGKWAAHVAGGGSRRMKFFMQTGARADFFASQRGWRTNWVRQGSNRWGKAPRLYLMTHWPWLVPAAAAAVTSGLLCPNANPTPAYSSPSSPSLAPPWSTRRSGQRVLVRFEAGLLADLGFGLDLSKMHGHRRFG